MIFDNAGEKTSFNGPVRDVTFGSDQYVWINDGPNSHADPDHAPVGTTISSSGPQAIFVLPKASITVLRGKINGAGK